MKTFVIANQKGGVGKTAIACHLSFFLRERGASVLHIDLDPQANSSKTLKAFKSGVVASSLFSSDAITLKVSKPGITLIEADAALIQIERADNQVIATFRTQVQALGTQFDYSVIDTAPTLGLRMSAALIAGNYVISPIELEGYSIDGIVHMIKTFRGIQQKYNPGLKFLGMLPNRYNAVSPAQKSALQELITKYASYLIPAKISNRTSISEALNQGIPVWQMNKTTAREAGKEIKAVLDIILKRSESE